MADNRDATISKVDFLFGIAISAVCSFSSISAGSPASWIVFTAPLIVLTNIFISLMAFTIFFLFCSFWFFSCVIIIFSIKSSVWRTFKLFLYIFSNTSSCKFSSFNFNKERTWRSVITLGEISLRTCGEIFNNLNLLAIVGWLFPIFLATSSWVILNSLINFA